MNTIRFQNGTYSAMHVAIVDARGGIGKLFNVPGGWQGEFRNLPNVDFSLSAFSSSDGSLQHVSKVRPSLKLVVIYPNTDAVVVRDRTEDDAGKSDEFVCEFSSGE